MEQMYSCPNCGAQIAFGIPSCPNCRAPLNWPSQPEAQPPPGYQQQQRQGQGTKMRKIIGWTVTIIGGFYPVLLVSIALDGCITGDGLPPINWLLLGISIVLVGIGGSLIGDLPDVKGSKGVCSKCGAQNKPDYRFCGSCGAKLS